METKSYTKAELRKLMESTGYSMASIEKTLRLLELLKAINADEFLSANLTLKGGTAITTLSTIAKSPDWVLILILILILLVIPWKKRCCRWKMKYRPVSEKCQLLWAILWATRAQTMLSTRQNLYYRSTTGNQDKIKLDINCLSRCHMYESVVRNARNPFLPDDESVTIIRKCIAYYLSLSRGSGYWAVAWCYSETTHTGF